MLPEYIRLIVDLARDIAWPLVVFLVAWMFKRELMAALPSLTRRKIEVEALGFRASMEAADQQLTVAENPAREKLPASTLEPSPNLVINAVESKLREQLQSVDQDKTEAVLLRALATTRVEAGHEFIYNRIFGSQIRVLKHLNEVVRLKIEDAKEFLKPFTEQFPQVYKDYNFDNWLGFLTSNLLVQQSGNILEITDIGRDFLRYVLDRRLAENKPL